MEDFIPMRLFGRLTENITSFVQWRFILDQTFFTNRMLKGRMNRLLSSIVLRKLTKHFSDSQMATIGLNGWGIFFVAYVIVFYGVVL